MATVHRLALSPDPTTSVDGTLRRLNETDDDDRAREIDGWRQGKPVEDPEKTKQWGFITAKPSEYLIHMRRGKIRRKTTGQGASCFKWPWDSIAIVPTTINRLQFSADQVTREKVGVQVTGLAVYRIVEPEVTFRMLNFSFSERASEKLAAILREMFVGATRRHVASLTVEEVITRRKDAIASELMTELAPVMRGNGEVSDSTQQGWGVVLDTVEIQDVRVLSETVFRDMQAEYRAQLAMRARQAELTRAQEIAAREAASTREIEVARIAAASATREMKAQAESRATEIEVAEESKRDALRTRASQEKIAREQDKLIAELRAQAAVSSEKAQQDEATRLAELAREQRVAEAERESTEARYQSSLRELALAHEYASAKTSNEAMLRDAESAARDVLERRNLALEEHAGNVRTALARAQKDIDNSISEDRIRMAMVQHSLPAIAQAFAQQFEEVRFTHIGGSGEGADPATMVARSIAQVIEIARSMGVRLGSSNEN